MRNIQRIVIVCFLLSSLPLPAFGQYGGNTNIGNSGGGTNTDRRRVREKSTSADEETDEQREARREKGLDEPVNKGAPAGIAKGPELVGKVDGSSWGKQTPEQQKASVEELTKFGEETKAKVNPNLVLNETKYFLFYSDLKPTEASKWAGVLDRMYGNLAGLFGIKGGENIFRGKAAVFVFAKEDDYQKFEKEMHDTDATGTAGMCHNFGTGEVHIGFFRQPNDMDFAAVLVHESVHGFLHRYRKPPSVPTWVNEGLAETIAGELVPQRGKRQELQQYAASQLRERGSFGRDFFTGDRLEGWQYPVAHLLTEFMIKESKKNYVAFIDGIKDGMKWSDALTQKYGVSQEQLVTAFADSLKIRGLSAETAGSTAATDHRRPESGRDQDQREREKEYQRDKE
jgi:hypothetical protein